MRGLPTLFVVLVACGSAPTTVDQASQTTFEELKASHQTVLTQHGPISKRWPESEPPSGTTRVTYASGELELWAWISVPEGPGPHPALVYLHGDKYLQASEWDLLRPFTEAGFAVMTPTLRGRNGNRGEHELIYGEVDDALAALRYMASQDNVDGSRLYLVGHSMGGATAAMASLHSDVRATLSASIGGIYSNGTFAAWKRQGGDPNLVPFDPDDSQEVSVRLFPRHVGELKIDHIAYMGEREKKIQANAADAVGRSGNRMRMRVVPGDHMTARGPALAHFLQSIREVP